MTLSHAAQAQTADGSRAHKADVAQTTYGVNGSGVKVCVISDSMDDQNGALAAARLSGAVPDFPKLRPLAGQAGIGTGDGLAMLEIIHKIAPGADLVFATNMGGPFQVAQNIRDLVQFSKCNIIVDDVTSNEESPFQDGAISRAINDAAAVGVIFVSAAGNAGSKTHSTSGTWEGDFKDGGLPPSPSMGSGKIHEFAPGKKYLTLTRRTDRVGLFWSDPWFDSTNKYSVFVGIVRPGQIFLVSPTDTFSPFQSVYAGIDSQTGNKLWFEPGDRIYVKKADGADPRFLHIDTYRGLLDLGTNGNIRGHAAAENVISVAAVPVPPLGNDGRTPPFSGGPSVHVEAQSSD